MSPNSTAVLAPHAGDTAVGGSDIRILRIEHSINGYGPIINFNASADRTLSHDTYLTDRAAWNARLEREIQALNISIDTMIVAYNRPEAQMRALVATMTGLDPIPHGHLVEEILRNPIPGFDDSHLDIGDILGDFLTRYPEPSHCTGAIGKLFKKTMDIDTDPWIFGILDTESRPLSAKACTLLDRHGFVVRTYVPSSHAAVVENGQVVFQKTRAACIQETSVSEAFFPSHRPWRLCSRR